MRNFVLHIQNVLLNQNYFRKNVKLRKHEHINFVNSSEKSSKNHIIYSKW